jgi:hypothetical protein
MAAAESLETEIKAIVSTVIRGKATFALGKTPKERARSLGLPDNSFASLAVGSPGVVKIPGGHLMMLGLKREQVEKLRDLCVELLAGDA